MLFAKFCLPTNSFASYFSSILVLRILFLISNLLNVPTYVVRQLQLSTMEKTKKDFGSRVDQVTKLEFFVFNFMCELSYLRVGEWVFGYFLRFLRPASMNWPPFLHQGLAWEDSSSLIPDMRWTHAVASFLLQDALNYWGHWTALRLYMFLAGQNIIWRSSVAGYWPEMIYFQYSQSIHIILLYHWVVFFLNIFLFLYIIRR